MSGRTNRRTPWVLLALAFVVVPLAEIYLIIQLGQVIGPWWTILVLLADGLLGSYFVKREGARAWRALTQTLSEGRMPADELADGALILVGGTLLLTPGFLSDVAGLFFIVPVTRPLARRVLARMIGRRWRGVAGVGRAGASPWGAQGGPGPTAPPGGDFVRGEVVEEDDPRS